MTASRDKNGILTGDLYYDAGYAVTVLSHITPVFYPCANCATLSLHVLVEEPTGVAIKIPFTRKALASTGKAYGLICNSCTATTGITGKELRQKLERRIVPAEICRALDTFFAVVPDVPAAYTEGFAKFLIPHLEGDKTFLATCLSVYQRES